MNTDPYTALHFPHDPPDPSPRLPEQTSFTVWTWSWNMPTALAGLFVVAYSGPSVIAFLGPFVGMYAIEFLMGPIFRALHALGADSYEIARKE